MSAKTWAAEYCGNLKEAKHWTDKQCFEHTIRKYKGVTDKILKQHGLVQVVGFLVPEGYEDIDVHTIPKAKRFDFNEKNCALCTKYKNYKYKNSCAKCPLSLAGMECGDSDAPYDAFCEDEKTKPMISAMEKMVKQCDKQGNWDL